MHNRRQTAHEFRTENAIVEAKNAELEEQLKLMKSELSKALGQKSTPHALESDYQAKAEHFQNQLTNLKVKHERAKEKLDAMEAQLCHYQLENDILIRKLAVLTPAPAHVKQLKTKTSSRKKSTRSDA